MTVEELWEEDLISEMGKLRVTPYDAKEYQVVSDTVVKLMDRKIELEKLRQDKQFKEQQLKEERTDRLIKNCIAAASIVVPAGIAIWGTVVSLNFEKEGVVTTAIGRGWINKLIPKK